MHPPGSSERVRSLAVRVIGCRSARCAGPAAPTDGGHRPESAARRGFTAGLRPRIIERGPGAAAVFGFGRRGGPCMPPTVDPDHDQRLEVLLKESFEASFRWSFPAWADRFAFADIPLERAAEATRLVGREEARALLLEVGCELRSSGVAGRASREASTSRRVFPRGEHSPTWSERSCLYATTSARRWTTSPRGRACTTPGPRSW